MVQRSLLIRFMVCAMVLALPITVFGNAPAKATGGGSSIQWEISAGPNAGVELRVIGPDGNLAFSKSFPAGKTPTLRLQDLAEVIDGQYTYELIVIPSVSADVAKRLENARVAGDDAEARKIMRSFGLGEAVTQSGGLEVRSGAFVSVGAVEPDAANSTPRRGAGPAADARPGQVVVNDQVIPDDLIVQGSICAGLDCVNNESFGFDTIRMKENNTRIDFTDTSSQAGFPTEDWEIAANDSASGGRNALIISDEATQLMVISAGTSANAIFVDSTGRVGFRTSTPVLDLHVATSNTPALRLEQNNSGGFTAQTWDVAGNEANFFVRDVTSGSRLSFRIRPGAPTSSVDISADGDTGIGTGSPEAKLHVFGASNADTFIGVGNDPDGSQGNESALTIGYSGSSFGRASAFLNVRPDTGAVAPNPSLRFLTGNNAAMIIDNQGFIGIGNMASGNPTNPIHYTNGGVTATLTTAGVWTDNSSRIAKENIVDLNTTDAFTTLRELKPVTYNYKVLPTDPKVGFIAEDVPAMVATPDRKGLSALDIVAVVTKVVQEQQKTIEQLNERIAQLEREKQQQ